MHKMFDVVLRPKTAFMFTISNTRKWINTDDVCWLHDCDTL